MSEQRFTIVGEEYVGYTQGNAYIISNGECKFSLWESKEDAQKVCDCLNEQQDTISQLREMNGQLREINKEIGDDLHNCRINKNIIREKLKLWQDVHKEYNIYNINDFEKLMKSIK